MEGQSDGIFGITAENRRASLQEGVIENAPFSQEQLQQVVFMQGNDEEILMLTDGGELWVYPYFENFWGTPPPDWTVWTGLKDVDTAWIFSGDYPQWMPCTAYAGVLKDGGVLAFPQVLQAAVSGWRGMKEVERIEAGYDFCVGIQRDGTLRLAGKFSFESEN